jgi:hypothetical protein
MLNFRFEPVGEIVLMWAEVTAINKGMVSE